MTLPIDGEKESTAKDISIAILFKILEKAKLPRACDLLMLIITHGAYLLFRWVGYFKNLTSPRNSLLQIRERRFTIDGRGLHLANRG